MFAGILQGLAQSGIEYGFGRAAAEDQLDQARRLAKKYPSWHAEGLERAGLNRILAIRPGGQGPPSPGMIPTPQVGANIQRANQNKAIRAGILKTEQDVRVGARQEALLKRQERAQLQDNILRDFSIAREAIRSGWLNDPKYLAGLKAREERGDSMAGVLQSTITQLLDYLNRLSDEDHDAYIEPQERDDLDTVIEGHRKVRGWPFSR